jgi:hypothetical protein
VAKKQAFFGQKWLKNVPFWAEVAEKRAFFRWKWLKCAFFGQKWLKNVHFSGGSG